MKKVGKTVLTCCLALGVLSGGVMASGKTINGASTQTSLGGTTTVEAWFNPSWKIVSGAGYGLTTGKYVKQSYVRIQEGDYDSGRIYSVAAANKTTSKEISVKTSKFNNPLKTMTTNYEVFKVRTEENDFTLTNYTNLIDSLVETTNRLVSLERDSNNMESDLLEATRIGNYISEMTLSLFDMELKTHEPLYRGIMEQSAKLVKLGIWMMLLTSLVLLLASYWFSLNITKSIQQLTKAVSELAKGKFNNKITVQSNDEILFLAKTFDLMRSNINNLIQQIQT